MKITYWKILVWSVVIIAFISYLFIFKLGQTEPSLLSLPFIFWSGIVMTTVLVILTFIGARIFPYKEDRP